MTIDGYLNQSRRLKNRVDKATKVLEEAESKAGIRSSLDRVDGIVCGRNNGNSTEARMIDYVDAGREYRDAQHEYKQFRDQLKDVINYLLHWEALIIEQVYIYNVFFGAEDDLFGVDEIIGKNNRVIMLQKLGIAKEHLRDLLRDRGIEID